MKKIIAIISTLAVLLPSLVLAAQFQFDAAITEGSVSFAPSHFFAGEPVRIYANIINQGTNDIAGGVSFFQGPSALGAPSPFSLKANGANEDVWLDWTPVEGTYNIMVKIETSTTDQSPSNNISVTPMMTIVKRPPPTPVAPQPVVSAPLPSLSSQTKQQNISSGQSSSASAVKDKATITSIAEQIAAKLTPKLPVNPSVSKTAGVQKPTPKKAAASTVSQPTAQKQVVGSQASLENSQQQPVPKQGVLGESVARGSDPVQSDINAAWQKNETQKGFGLPHSSTQKQNDPVRTGIAISVFLTLIFLGAGFYFLKISRA